MGNNSSTPLLSSNSSSSSVNTNKSNTPNSSLPQIEHQRSSPSPSPSVKRANLRETNGYVSAFPPHLLNFPRDTWKLIFSYLDVVSLVNASQVSKLWKELTYEDVRKPNIMKKNKS